MASVINPPKRSVPFSSGKRAKFYTQNAATAALKAQRRRSRSHRTGHPRAAAGYRGWPEMRSQKQGKNMGKAPTYTSRLLKGDVGERPGTGGWPFPEGTPTKWVK